ncbi:hypothetical protein SJAG_00422 [Schizosaccharomyces japonicus yFS275]|uniref:Uncharacterized protein n=1 Tax=Schizosaccharomyces japonicus (strain yFS275 / FY16936) TaxID=402676 RepID=B6JVK8_SCHJY|nr:hypothetical protein SJAG_00422 [Schizosaccharomyces japonicus yFS275]EEB05409.1 hypothetical protein SJAG_00422 [Schizosaccharomyces japonicus yFS275]
MLKESRKRESFAQNELEDFMSLNEGSNSKRSKAAENENTIESNLEYLFAPETNVSTSDGPSFTFSEEQDKKGDGDVSDNIRRGPSNEGWNPTLTELYEFQTFNDHLAHLKPLSSNTEYKHQILWHIRSILIQLNGRSAVSQVVSRMMVDQPCLYRLISSDSALTGDTFERLTTLVTNYMHNCTQSRIPLHLWLHSDTNGNTLICSSHIDDENAESKRKRYYRSLYTMADISGTPRPTRSPSHGQQNHLFSISSPAKKEASQSELDHEKSSSPFETVFPNYDVESSKERPPHTAFSEIDDRVNAGLDEDIIGFHAFQMKDTDLGQLIIDTSYESSTLPSLFEDC